MYSIGYLGLNPCWNRGIGRVASLGRHIRIIPRKMIPTYIFLIYSQWVLGTYSFAKPNMICILLSEENKKATVVCLRYGRLFFVIVDLL